MFRPRFEGSPRLIHFYDDQVRKEVNGFSPSLFLSYSFTGNLYHNLDTHIRLHDNRIPSYFSRVCIRDGYTHINDQRLIRPA